VITGTAAGADALPAGVCEGLVTGLSDLSVLGTRVLDDNGSFTASGHGPDCAILLQVVDPEAAPRVP